MAQKFNYTAKVFLSHEDESLDHYPVQLGGYVYATTEEEIREKVIAEVEKRALSFFPTHTFFPENLSYRILY